MHSISSINEIVNDIDNNNELQTIIINAVNNDIKTRVDEIDKIYTYTENVRENVDEKISDNKLFEVNDIIKSFKTNFRKRYYSKTQKWIGHILEIKDEIIIAKLNDLNNPTTHEIAEFEIGEVPYEDRSLISKGAGFYWSLGYSNDENGQIEKKSLIRFQRTKPWNESDLDSIFDEADDSYNKLENWS